MMEKCERTMSEPAWKSLGLSPSIPDQEVGEGFWREIDKSEKEHCMDSVILEGIRGTNLG